MLDRVAALEQFEQSGRLDTPLGRINASAARMLLHVRDQLLREMRPSAARAGDGNDRRRGRAAGAVGGLSRPPGAADRPGSRFGRMVGGRGVRLAPSSAVRDAPLFLAVDVDAGTSEALVWKASAVERRWLPAEHLSLRNEVEFDPEARRVIARRRLYWEDLLLEETPAALPDDAEVAAVLTRAGGRRVGRSLSLGRSGHGRLRAAGAMPGPMDAGVAVAGIGRAGPAGTAAGRLLRAAAPSPSCVKRHGGRRSKVCSHPSQRQAVEREAPERIQVPSGSRIALRYELGKPPVLAVRIQEIFGLLATPRVAGGRVAVLCHLLAPNMRPQQITDDLASFWKNTYPQVRKDLRRRYPKHAWPEDPLEASGARPGRKG